MGMLTLYHVDYHAAGATLPVTGTDPRKRATDGGAVHARAHGWDAPEQTFSASIPAESVMRPAEWVWDGAERPRLLAMVRKAFPLLKQYGAEMSRVDKDLAYAMVASCLQWPRVHWNAGVAVTRQQWLDRAEQFLCQWAFALDKGFQAVETGAGLYVLLPGVTLTRCSPEAKR